MKTQKNNTLKKILIAAFIAIGLFLAIPFGFGMYSGFKLHTGVTGEIETTISNHCNCESVTSDISAMGIQYSKEDGMTHQKASYILTDCNFTGSAKEEAIKINDALKRDVEEYEKLDIIELTFQFGEITETVKIKEGNIL